MWPRCFVALTLLAAPFSMPVVVIPVWAAETLTVRTANVADEKAVFATVESPNVVPARARIGGTVAELSVRQGDAVRPGQVIAVVGDEKLLLTIAGLEAQIAAAAVATRAGADRPHARRRVVPPGRRHAGRDGPGTHRDGCRDLDLEGARGGTRCGAAATRRGPGAGAGRRPGAHRAGDQRHRRAERRSARHDRREQLHPAAADAGAACRDAPDRGSGARRWRRTRPSRGVARQGHPDLPDRSRKAASWPMPTCRVSATSSSANASGSGSAPGSGRLS